MVFEVNFRTEVVNQIQKSFPVLWVENLLAYIEAGFLNFMKSVHFLIITLMNQSVIVFGGEEGGSASAYNAKTFPMYEAAIPYV